MLKTKTFFAHPITKPPASILEFKNFDTVFQNFGDLNQKREKSPHPADSQRYSVSSKLSPTPTNKKLEKLNTKLGA